MGKKALYKHKRSSNLFAIETDERGDVICTSGPLLTKDLKADELDYDNYWDEDIKAQSSTTGRAGGLLWIYRTISRLVEMSVKGNISLPFVTFSLISHVS